MSRVNISDFTRRIDALNRSYGALPDEIAALAVKFSKERFVEQAWLDNTKENWASRSRNRRSIHGNRTRNQTLLVQTGRLKRSIRKISAVLPIIFS
ncbi:MAG: hypothetical protein LBS50_04760 [Prevotellaceae bacterium]|jgi:hypothetical protein|nr:hypothetical protein [Prevotellaceae bacterium]